MKRSLFQYIGPGIVSGASDNDPTTVASLAVIGSTTIYGLGWLTILVIPMLAVVQAISARVGAVTHTGLQADALEQYGRVAGWILLCSVVGVTFVTLVADLEGGSAALQLLSGVDYRWWIVPFAAASIAMLILGSYERIKNVLLIFPLAFLAYPVAAILAHPDWHAVVIGTFVPHFERSKDFAAGTIALLGTTLTSYAYVWQTVESAKERPPLRRLGLVQVDTTLGTIVAGLSFWAIVVATGATLGVHHQTVETADEAARALEPVAGPYARLIFAIGLLGSALIAVPILMATIGYMFRDAFKWRGSLDSTLKGAPKFYGAMIAMASAAALTALLGLPPVKVLFLSSNFRRRRHADFAGHHAIDRARPGKNGPASNRKAIGDCGLVRRRRRRPCQHSVLRLAFFITGQLSSELSCGRGKRALERQ